MSASSNIPVTFDSLKKQLTQIMRATEESSLMKDTQPSPFGEFAPLSALRLRLDASVTASIEDLLQILNNILENVNGLILDSNFAKAQKTALKEMCIQLNVFAKQILDLDLVSLKSDLRLIKQYSGGIFDDKTMGRCIDAIQQKDIEQLKNILSEISQILESKLPEGLVKNNIIRILAYYQDRLFNDLGIHSAVQKSQPPFKKFPISVKSLRLSYEKAIESVRASVLKVTEPDVMSKRLCFLQLSVNKLRENKDDYRNALLELLLADCEAIATDRALNDQQKYYRLFNCLYNFTKGSIGGYKQGKLHSDIIKSLHYACNLTDRESIQVILMMDPFSQGVNKNSPHHIENVIGVIEKELSENKALIELKQKWLHLFNERMSAMNSHETDHSMQEAFSEISKWFLEKIQQADCWKGLYDISDQLRDKVLGFGKVHPGEEHNSLKRMVIAFVRMLPPQLESLVAVLSSTVLSSSPATTFASSSTSSVSSTHSPQELNTKDKLIFIKECLEFLKTKYPDKSKKLEKLELACKFTDESRNPDKQLGLILNLMKEFQDKKTSEYSAKLLKNEPSRLKTDILNIICCVKTAKSRGELDIVKEELAVEKRDDMNNEQRQRYDKIYKDKAKELRAWYNLENQYDRLNANDPKKSSS